MQQIRTGHYHRLPGSASLPAQEPVDLFRTERLQRQGPRWPARACGTSHADALRAQLQP